MTGKKKRCLFIFFFTFLFTVFSCLSFFTVFNSGIYAAASFSVEEGGYPDGEGHYLITSINGFKVSYRLLYGGSPDFNFRRGFRMEWESDAGTLTDGTLKNVKYEISFLASGAEGIIINQNESSISVTRVSGGISKEKYDIETMLVPSEVSVSFEASGEDFIFALNGEDAAKWPLEAFAAKDETAAELYFTNKSEKFIDTVKIISLSPGAKNALYADPYLSYYDVFIKEPVTVTIKGGYSDISIYREEKGGLTAVPDKQWSYVNKDICTDIILSGTVFAENMGASFVAVTGSADHYFKVELKDTVQFSFESEIDYTVGSGDVILPVETFHIEDIVIRRNSTTLLERQGAIEGSFIRLNADYLESVYNDIRQEERAEARFNILGVNALGVTVEKTLTVIIVKDAVLPEEPDEPPPEEPDEPPKEPNEPSEKPDEPSEPYEPPEEPVDPSEEPDKNPDEKLPDGPGAPPANTDGNDTNALQPGKGGDAPSTSDKESIGVGSGGKTSPDITLPAVFVLTGGSLLVMSAPLFVLSLRKNKMGEK